MKQYIVITNPNQEELGVEVTRLLNDGWSLAGGVSTAYEHRHGIHGEHIPGQLVFTQALEKKALD